MLNASSSSQVCKTSPLKDKAAELDSDTDFVTSKLVTARVADGEQASEIQKLAAENRKLKIINDLLRATEGGQVEWRTWSPQQPEEDAATSRGLSKRC